MKLNNESNLTKDLGNGFVLDTSGALTEEMLRVFLHRIFNPTEEERLENEKRKQEEWEKFRTIFKKYKESTARK